MTLKNPFRKPSIEEKYEIAISKTENYITAMDDSHREQRGEISQMKRNVSSKKEKSIRLYMNNEIDEADSISNEAYNLDVELKKERLLTNFVYAKKCQGEALLRGLRREKRQLSWPELPNGINNKEEMLGEYLREWDKMKKDGEKAIDEVNVFKNELSLSPEYNAFRTELMSEADSRKETMETKKKEYQNKVDEVDNN